MALVENIVRVRWILEDFLNTYWNREFIAEKSSQNTGGASHTMGSVKPITISEMQDAREYIKKKLNPTPLVPLRDNKMVYLKLENLQPIGSFKLRGALNAIRKIPTEKLKMGVYTASAGNFAQGLAWNAQVANIPCNVIVPSHAPITKVTAVENLGGIITKVDFDQWWKVIESYHFEGMNGTFIHPCCDPDVIAGNGSIGLEIMEALPDVDNIIVPYGGGGLLCGVAMAAKAIKPDVKVYACEVETACPLKTSLDAGEPKSFPYQASFVDGMGGKSIIQEMWPLVKSLVTDSIVVSLRSVADAVKLISERNNVRAEGAGAATVAAALKDRAVEGKTVCVISGGNIDTHKYIQCLEGNVPT